VKVPALAILPLLLAAACMFETHPEHAESDAPDPEFINGQEFLYAGRTYSIELENGRASPMVETEFLHMAVRGDTLVDGRRFQVVEEERIFVLENQVKSARAALGIEKSGAAVYLVEFSGPGIADLFPGRVLKIAARPSLPSPFQDEVKLLEFPLQPGKAWDYRNADFGEAYALRRKYLGKTPLTLGDSTFPAFAFESREEGFAPAWTVWYDKSKVVKTQFRGSIHIDQVFIHEWVFAGHRNFRRADSAKLEALMRAPPAKGIFPPRRSWNG
jgi:hypothetical protein